MSKHDQWYTKIDGKTHGPFTSEQLRVQATAGTITPSTRVRPGTDGEWVPASKVKGLFPPEATIEPARAQSSRFEPEQVEPVPEPVTPDEPPATSDALTPPPVAQQPPPAANPDGNSHGAASVVLGVLALMTFAVPLVGLVFAALGDHIGHKGRRIASEAGVEPSGLTFAGRWVCWIAGALAAVVTLAWLIVAAATVAAVGGADRDPPAIERRIPGR